MNPADALSSILKATRRSIDLLDRELRGLAAYDADVLAALSDADQDVMPAFFDVIGADGNPGVNMGGVASPARGSGNPFFGIINLAPDAPFVLTSFVGILENSAFDSSPSSSGGDGYPGGSSFFENLIDATDASGQPLAEVLGVRLFDVANASEITNKNADGARTTLLPAEALFGHLMGGDVGDAQLSETVYPKAASIRVEGYWRTTVANALRNVTRRLHVIACGYKVFGD